MIAAALSFAPSVSFAKDKKMNGPEVVEIADISVGLSGLVCDYCSDDYAGYGGGIFIANV